MDYVREAREFLYNYRDYKIANDNLRDRLRKLDNELEGYKPINYSDMPHGSNGDNPDDKLCNLIFFRDRTKEQLELNIEQLESFENILSNLKEEYRIILLKSYVEELPETIILKDINMSRRTYFREKGKAIRSLARQLFGIKVSGY